MAHNAEELRQLARRWIEEGWQRGNVDMVDELHSVDFVDQAAAGRASDREGFKQGIRGLYQAFPDFHADIEDLIVDRSAGMVAIRWKAKGTHRGVFMGKAPTGRSIRFQGIEIIRVEGGRIRERWGEWDGISLIAQLQGPA